MIDSSFTNTFTRPRSTLRLARLLTLLLAFALSAAGCGVKTAYNNVDRLIKWSIDDYMKLDPAQEAYFQAELDAVLYWHRTTQLPVYAKAIREFDAEIAKGASVEDLFVFNKEVEGWWDQVLEASMPLSTQLMYSATDAQLDQFAVQYEKDIKKYIKPYEKLTEEERRARWARDFRDYFEYFTRLNNEQKQMIVAQSRRFTPDDESWADYRRRYGAALIALVRERQPYVQFSRAYREMTFGRERWYGEEYAAALESNKNLYRDVTLALLDSLTADQRRDLSKNLMDVAKDLDELTADAPPVSPPAACLITC